MNYIKTCYIVFSTTVLFQSTAFSQSSNYAYTDLPSVRKVDSKCDGLNESNYMASWQLGKVTKEEIKNLDAIVYEVPSGVRHIVNLGEAPSTLSFQMTGLHPNRRHIVYLIVILRNATANTVSDVLWSQEHHFTTCGTENRTGQCLCDPVGSLNTSANCHPGQQECHCHGQFTGADCSLCVDNFYRDYANYASGCLPCQCSNAGGGNFAGPCAWSRTGKVGASPESQVSRRRCIGCVKGYTGEACTPVTADISLGAQVAIVLSSLIGLLLLSTILTALCRQCRRRAMRASRHSLAVQRLFSRFKDDSSLEAEASAILAEDDALQRATQQLRLGADPVYQPTTVSIT